MRSLLNADRREKIRQAVPYLRRISRDALRTRWILPRRQDAAFCYSVVAAAWNVEKYLDDFFASLTGQSLDFSRNIQVILVDDGSSDATGVIARQWQERYPHAIRYLFQENAGQGAARNLGLEYATGDWVTFIDPDDFVDCRYFDRVDRFLAGPGQKAKVRLLSCNFVFYYEHSGRYLDKHVLRQRFEQDRIVPMEEFHTLIQPNVNSVFFEARELKRQAIRFDGRRWPRFEDGHFCLRYLAGMEDGAAAFLRGAEYYYRKRQDLSSSLDTSRQRAAYYLDNVRQGYIELLEGMQTKGPVPAFVQRGVLYSFMFRLRYLLDQPSPPCLDLAAQKEFLAYCRRLAGLLDTDLVWSYPAGWSGISDIHKAGLIRWQGKTEPFPRYRLAHINWKRDAVCLEYDTVDKGAETIRVDGCRLSPLTAKWVKRSLLGETFAWTRRLWLTLPDGAKSLSLLVNGKVAVREEDGAEVLDIRNLAGDSGRAAVRGPAGKYARSWLFMDRPAQADDNAEHLYRHVMEEGRSDIFFVLDRCSPDWKRLEKEGFSLLAYRGAAHKAALASCAVFITSHLDAAEISPFKDLPAQHRLVFLQHGVTKDNMANWLRGKPVDLVITSCRGEHQDMVRDEGSYSLCENEVSLSGMPRLDGLYRRMGKEEKTILVMPTWRRFLVRWGYGHEHRRNPDFACSVFAVRWQELLNHPKMRDLVEQKGYYLLFHPHPLMRPYVRYMGLGSHVSVAAEDSGSIQDTLAQARLLLTDYSSVAFDAAFMEKPVLYYQFDRQDVFGGGHPTLPGYFDYRQDGFGPVCESAEAVLEQLPLLLEAGMVEPYRARMLAAFVHRDADNCRRTYAAIRRMELEGEEGACVP